MKYQSIILFSVAIIIFGSIVWYFWRRKALAEAKKLDASYKYAVQKAKDKAHTIENSVKAKVRASSKK